MRHSPSIFFTSFVPETGIPEAHPRLPDFRRARPGEPISLEDYDPKVEEMANALIDQWSMGFSTDEIALVRLGFSSREIALHWPRATRRAHEKMDRQDAAWRAGPEQLAAYMASAVPVTPSERCRS